MLDCLKERTMFMAVFPSFFFFNYFFVLYVCVIEKRLNKILKLRKFIKDIVVHSNLGTM